LEKQNQQEAMIGSLLTKSGEEIKDKESSQKIERLYVKMNGEIIFVKNYIAQVVNDQNVLMSTMIEDTRNVKKFEYPPI
jgi:hypothetical protein